MADRDTKPANPPIKFKNDGSPFDEHGRLCTGDDLKVAAASLLARETITDEEADQAADEMFGLAQREERETVVAYLRNEALKHPGSDCEYALNVAAGDIARGEHVADADYGSLNDMLPATVRREALDQVHEALDRLCSQWSDSDGAGDTYQGLSMARALVEEMSDV